MDSGLPSTPDERRRHRLLQERERRYGGSVFTPMPEVYSIIEHIVSPSTLGFEPFRERVWVQRRDDEHASILSFRPTKGSQVQIEWGTSVTYVPVKLLPRLRWARTLKQSKAALWETSGDFWPQESVSVVNGGIATSQGPQCVEDDARKVWTTVRDKAIAFWDLTSTPDGLLAAAEQQAAHGSIHAPRPGLTAAFALARLGDITAARARLTNLASVLTADELQVAEQAIGLQLKP